MLPHPLPFAALLLLVACATTPTGDPGDPGVPGEPLGITAVVAGGDTAHVPLGEPIPVELRNRSGGTATVGALDCLADLERWDPRRRSWQRLGTLRACIEIAVLVADGEDHPFAVPSPDATGRYRIVFEAYGGSSGVLMTVRSNTVEVTPAP